MEIVDLQGINYRTDKPVRISLRDKRISSIEDLEGSEGKNLPYIAPGLIDIQVNGMSGVDFNAPDLKIEDLKRLCQNHYASGVTTYFPTLVTNSNDAISSEIETIINACKTDTEISEIIGGIHIEGPFISKQDQARGAHNINFITAPDWNILENWQKKASGMIKIITLSPEWNGTQAFIDQCVNNNILVAIGHTSASPEQIRNAVDAGARLSTHLGNAMHINIPRKNNYFWEQLTQDDLWASFIADGFHVSDQLLKVLIKLKNQRLILVSDSTKFTNQKPGKYESIIGGNVVLTEQGKLYMEDNPDMLAGSAQTIFSGVNNLINKVLCSIRDAWDMASVKPVELLKLYPDYGLYEGSPADLVLFEKNNTGLKLLQTFKSGKLVYSA